MMNDGTMCCALGQMELLNESNDHGVSWATVHLIHVRINVQTGSIQTQWNSQLRIRTAVGLH